VKKFPHHADVRRNNLITAAAPGRGANQQNGAVLALSGLQIGLMLPPNSTGSSSRCRKRPMSAFGTKRTSPSALHMSAFGGKADIIVLYRRLRCANACRPGGGSFK
jgi:hypothetical protein